ncbi:MAG: hypothetical protein EXS31_11855 [Pedosphaera sp.]|nr:hypothetical protein [Pedosphaera sp.]
MARSKKENGSTATIGSEAKLLEIIDHIDELRFQYASHAYVKAAGQAGLTMSMTENNHSAENAVAERVNGILKQEYWLDAEFATLASG